jgi:hypothetical protein
MHYEVYIFHARLKHNLFSMAGLNCFQNFESNVVILAIRKQDKSLNFILPLDPLLSEITSKAHEH